MECGDGWQRNQIGADTVEKDQSLLRERDEWLGSHLVAVFSPEESEPGFWKRVLLLAL